MSTSPAPAAALHPIPRHILPVIALSQFAGTSLWFAINAVMADLQRDTGLPASAVGWFTSAVQLGFILGTLMFALWGIADRFSPRRVFLVCSLAGAACAALCTWLPPTLPVLTLLRFLTGVFLAGIYPVGMKIAAGWYARGLGLALGVLVGALVLGTAAPFGLRALGASWTWQGVMLAVAAIAALGGVLMAWLVPDGPHLAPPAKFSARALLVIVHDPKVRASAFGYFGHMWELYAFMVLLPLIVAPRFAGNAGAWWVFAGIAAGAVSCVGGGLAARRFGSARLAAWQLGCSACCCLLAPWLLDAPLGAWAVWVLLWGASVAGDSPQFSALTAANAPRAQVGSVLTLVNCIGFSISVATITGFVALAAHWPLAQVLPWLALGPVLGLLSMRPLFSAAKSPGV